MSLSGLVLSQEPAGAIDVAPSGLTGIVGLRPQGLAEPDPSPSVEADAEDLQATTLPADGDTQPPTVLPESVEPAASVPRQNDMPSSVDRTAAGPVTEVDRKQPPSSPARAGPGAGVAVRFETPARADVRGRSTADEMNWEEPPTLDLLHDGLRQLRLPVKRLDDGALKLSLRREVPFRFDSAEVPERSRRVLDRLAALLAEHGHWTLTVVGHTDDTGTDDYNLRLSLERAKSVADYLVERGLPANRVFSEGKGESEPVSAGETEAGYRKWLDRRIEILIQPTERPPRRGGAVSYR